MGYVAAAIDVNDAAKVDSVIPPNGPPHHRSGAIGLRDVTAIAICAEQRSKNIGQSLLLLLVSRPVLTVSQDDDLDLVRELFLVESEL